MIVLGLTGQSGTGTSAAGEILAKAGACFINADQVYHRLLEQDDELNRSLVQAFGTSVLQNGKVNRKALAALVFADSNALATLNRLTHGVVAAEIKKMLQACADNPAVVEAIALFESGLAALCTHTLALTAEYDIRLHRIMARDNLSLSAAKVRLAAQKDESFYTSRASFTLVNNGGKDALEKAVLSLWQKINQE